MSSYTPLNITDNNNDDIIDNPFVEKERYQTHKRSGCFEKLFQYVGYTSIELHPDCEILFACKGIRLFSFGFLAVMLVVYLEAVGLEYSNIGLLFTLTLLGDALISLCITAYADRFGRRKSLLTGGVLSAFTSIAFVSQSNFIFLLVSAILGVISPSGNEVGPFMAIELSGISQITSDEERTTLLALYNLTGSFSSAIGALVCGGMITLLSQKFDFLMSYRLTWLVYIIAQLLLVLMFYKLGPSIEYAATATTTIAVQTKNPIKLFLGLHKSKAIVLQLSCLFVIDSFAGSFILQSLISSWFANRFDTPAALLGTIVFICNIVAGISALVAAKLAAKIGLIMTMVVTHIPSNLLTMLVPLMPTERLAILMLCLRYSISQMDVPTRNAYVQGVVDPDERSAANGVTNVARSIGASIGPILAGMLYAHNNTSNYPWFIAGGLKIVYDILLLLSFKSVKPSGEG